MTYQTVINDPMRKTLLLACLISCLALGNGFAQNPYYWSGGQKITLVPDSTQILVTLRQGADATRSRSRVESFVETVAANLPVEWQDSRTAFISVDGMAKDKMMQLFLSKAIVQDTQVVNQIIANAQNYLR